jgi:ubiquitin carboxyl-terminal hydrolase L3
MSTQTTAAIKSWLPVESNPIVFNEYAARLGWPTDKLSFADLLSTEDWACEMLPAPVRAVAMLYLIKPCHEAHRALEEETRAAAAAPAPDSMPLFIKQEIANACGTIALVHALAAAAGDVELAPDCWLTKFLAKAAPMEPEGIAAMLGEDEQLEVEQAVAVAGGQSDQVEDTWQHFVCFVERGGRLWELDGRKGGPIDHGALGDGGTLLAGAIRVMKAYMARDPEEVRFTMLALCPPVEEEA